MKRVTLIIALFFSLQTYSQVDSNISVVSIEKVNVVYRGINNPIKIGVPGAKSYTVTAPGALKKIDSLGNYYWNVTSVTGTKTILKIDIVMQDESIRHEEKEFNIKNINVIMTTVNGMNSLRCAIELTKEQIKSAEIGLKIDDFALNFPMNYDYIYLDLPDEKTIYIDGTKLNEEAEKAIDKLKNGDKIKLYASKRESEARIAPAEIIIVKDHD